MTDGTPTRAQRFAALVVPAAELAGYTGHGAKARFARDTGLMRRAGGHLRAGDRPVYERLLEEWAAAVRAEMTTAA